MVTTPPLVAQSLSCWQLITMVTTPSQRSVSTDGIEVLPCTYVLMYPLSQIQIKQIYANKNIENTLSEH